MTTHQMNKDTVTTSAAQVTSNEQIAADPTSTSANSASTSPHPPLSKHASISHIDADRDEESRAYLLGWRLYALTFSQVVLLLPNPYIANWSQQTMH